MDSFDVLATSYAPGHNFWPGSPYTWWVRGILGFFLVAGPQVSALVLAVWWCRRRRVWMNCVIALAAGAGVCLLWPQIIGLNFRDGDMPWYLGLKWGEQARAWLLAATFAGSVAAVATKPRDRRGFPVIAEATPS